MNAEFLFVEPIGETSGLSHQDFVGERLRSSEAIRDAFAQRPAHAIWIAASKQAVVMLARTLPSRRNKEFRLLLLGRSKSARENMPAMHAQFRHVVSELDGVRLLPRAELLEVFAANNRAELFIGGVVNAENSYVLLYRGNLEPITVPLTAFRTSGDGIRPNFSDFSVVNFGHSIRFGEYEASTDAILYEFDEEYRRIAKKRRVVKDPSLGGAIKRLRLQKGLTQADFPGISARTIRRIEQGQDKGPQASTLRKIAKVTGVPVEQIESF